MNLRDLKKVLDEAGVLPNVYCLEGGYPSEQYCIENNYGRWSVYYSERGQRTAERMFYSEDAACRYMYEIIIKDPTTRQKKEK